MAARSPAAKAQQIRQLLDLAMTGGSMDTALTRFGQGLTPAETAAFKSLTPDELRALARVKQKLGQLTGAADNNIY